MILYLSGPISSDPEGYRRKFWQAADYLKFNLGHTVLNPAILPEGLKSYDDYIKIGLSMMAAADGIVLLDGWKKSNGARIEVRAAAKTGKKIFFGLLRVPKQEEAVTTEGKV